MDLENLKLICKRWTRNRQGILRVYIDNDNKAFFTYEKNYICKEKNVEKPVTSDFYIEEIEKVKVKNKNEYERRKLKNAKDNN